MTEAQFWERVERSPDGCWPYRGNQHGQGYGMVSLPMKRRILAHRFAAALTLDDFDPLLLVCHRCDNRACVRPSHLFMGTASDNMQDCIAKGRFVHNPAPLGEAHWFATTTEAKVREIRARAASGEQQKALAAEYGLTTATVNDIVLRRSWKWVV